jgi:hypothetical protein
MALAVDKGMRADCWAVGPLTMDANAYLAGAPTFGFAKTRKSISRERLMVRHRMARPVDMSSRRANRADERRMCVAN